MEINQLAVKAKNGDLSAFEQLYDSCAQRIFSHIRVKIHNPQDAEDILQDVFLKTYQGLKTLRPKELNFLAWLFKITDNTVHDYFRKKYRQPEVVSIDESFDFPDKYSLNQDIMAKSDLETVWANFPRLSKRHRAVLELRFFWQMSVDEVAKTLNKSRLAVRMLQYRARKKLKWVSEKKFEARYAQKARMV